MWLRRAFRCGVLLLGALSCSTSAFCRITSLPDIAKLTSSSFAIVVGEVLRVARVGVGEIPMPNGKPFECERLVAFIRVDEVLKGEVASGIIEVDYLQNSTWDGPLTNSLAEGTFRMFFLNLDRDKFAFTAPQQSSMPMSRSVNALPGNSDGDVYTRVLSHLAQGLFAEADSSQDRIQSMFVIDHEPSPMVADLYKLALNGPAARSDPAFRFELIAALVRHKDVSILPELETALLGIHDDAAANARGNMIYALQEVDAAVAGPILIEALRLPEPQLRAAAAAALWHAPSEDAIAALSECLDDSDRNVRWSSINTLTSIFHEPQCLPQSNEEELFSSCVEHWKRFLAAKGAATEK
jgi:hypothetical protein